MIIIICILIFNRFIKDHKTIIIMDDNLPLRSMRYEYYQMARKCMNILHY